MNYSTVKLYPFDRVHEGERLEDRFFQRMKRFENYYKNLAKKDSQYESNYQIIRKINELLCEDLMSQKDVWNIVQYYEENSNKDCHMGSGWLDTRLHLKHLAFVYGLKIETADDLNLKNE